MAILTASHMACAFGILGNIVSFLVYLAPLPTFYRICKKKSTEGFQSIPYAVALFSAMLLLYYGFLKKNGLMIITINTIGCAIEATYLILFMLYATKEAKIYTTKLLIFFNVIVYGLIILCTSLLSNGKLRVTIVGWICAVFSVCVFAAPLSIMRLVIRTKSVEYMPFALSFFLTLCAIMWFFYGFLIKDFYIATPNILGFAFGIAQMVLYMIYKDYKKQVLPEFKLQDLPTTVINLRTMIEMQENFKAGTDHVQEEHATNE
ncbi:Bidirectional sugar transporter like [Actinidia chinensis var. chinensis]|uniref:Bidirectional sugar transporter SWEET n=1 Tax=Actinidia chinensis var. chinensis TaxID=1590841 RepID=A0A2R6P5Y2_ACTCC|nr:Bidirectional sugar transporter like [Actinidia chinensis var. chinensis]